MVNGTVVFWVLPLSACCARDTRTSHLAVILQPNITTDHCGTLYKNIF